VVGLLACWCGGLLAGQTALSPTATPLALAAGGSLGALMLTAGPPGWLRSRHLLLLVWLTAALLGMARGASTIHVVDPASLDYYLGRHVTLSGTVSRSSGSAAFQSVWVRDIVLQGHGRVAGTTQVTARATSSVVPGSTVRVIGTLERLPGRAFDGSTGYDDRMEREGVLAAIPGAGVEVLRPPSPWSTAAMAWRLRASMTSAVRSRVPEPGATVLLGELVGIRGKLPTGVEADLVGSGLVHLLAVSGLKVALLAGVMAGLLRQAGRRAALLAIIGIFAYAVVGGGSSAAVRSAIMGSAALVAQVVRRDVDPVRGLLLAGAVMLGLNPALAGDLSFQYSFLGVAGIQLMHRGVSQRIGFMPRPFREALSVSMAAQLATLPLTAAYFHVVPMSGPLANTVAVPVLPPSLAVAAWVAVGMPDPGGIVASTADGFAHALLGLAHAAVLAPAGALAVPWFGLPHAAGYYAAAVVVVAAHRLGVRPGRAGAGAVATAMMVLLWMSRPDGRMHLVLMATPGGGALVTAPDGARMLVDTGDSPAALATELDAQLAPPDPRLDAVLLTGSAPAAAGGVAGLGPRVPALLLLPLDPVGDVPSLVAGAFAAHGTGLQRLAPGDRWRWHGLDLATGDCGDGLSVSVRLGASLAWFCSAGTSADPGAVPQWGGMVIDIGEGRVPPDGSLASATWVVEHTSGSARGVASATSLGAKTWRTSKDGPLLLTCDQAACAR
jgi:competence protein ComEC